MSATNIVWHTATVQKKERQQSNQHKSCILWFTGLSGSGKSTLANEVEKKLFELGAKTYTLDGDNVRHGLNQDLGFTDEDRVENIRRIAEVSKLFVDAGVIVLTAFISPFKQDRQVARDLVESSEFIEIYVKCSLEECERRDPKGLYEKARRGEIPHFTGISSPYEEPLNPELVIENDQLSVQQAVEQIIEYLKKEQLI
ncbi:adenylyl-sulfate kinase [Ammoniphilus oxalaticus]|uniref:Adenylyl-sulfate kinase n=1 Tax=Ammoniphilus oxalaticus TaxID=66863 RepID=A0A419SQP8_9BACL|nr:adenylyl-sulfate kinase [Ammoniphilus oxalaticus]RKD26727.1 adenylyl-sulfate kinase [Ammoniphilus oxalaticus]